MSGHILAYVVSFIAIWLGAGLIIDSVDDFSKRLRLSSFSVSFFFLGLLTSIPEFSVGITAIGRHDPSIYMGNLLGGIVILFLFVIPLLAVLGREIRMERPFTTGLLLPSFAVLLLPSLSLLDRTVTPLEGFVMIGAYLTNVIFVERHHGILDGNNKRLVKMRRYSILDVVKLLAGAGIVFLSSRVIVDNTIYFAHLLGVSPFIVSLIFMSIGTNLPELSLVLRSVVKNKKDIALGDYIGSALANVLFFGIFSILSTGDNPGINNYVTAFVSP